MASPTTGPCEPWTTDEEVRRCCVGLDPAYDLTDAIWWASVILWRKTGRRFHGLCERVIYPCKGDNCGCCGELGWLGGNTEVSWNWAFGGYGGWGGPSGAMAYPIPGGFANVGLCDRRCKLPCVQVPGPISGVLEIIIDGQVLDRGFYKTKAFGEICRVDGGNWPCSNDLTCLPQPTIVTLTVDAAAGTYDLTVTLGDGNAATALAIPYNATAAALEAILEALPNVGVGNVAVIGGPGDPGGTTPYTIEFVGALGNVFPTIAGTALVGGAATAVKVVEQLGCTGVGSWQIRYLFGRTIDRDARYMASLLACQIALNRCGGEGCILPQRLKEITRQGVAMAFADPLDFLDKGEVGIYEIDLWIKDLNPAKLQRRASVHRADARKHDGGNTTFT